MVCHTNIANQAPKNAFRCNKVTVHCLHAVEHTHSERLGSLKMQRSEQETRPHPNQQPWETVVLLAK